MESRRFEKHNMKNTLVPLSKNELKFIEDLVLHDDFVAYFAAIHQIDTDKF